MLKKEEIAVKLTKKNTKKVYKLLKMFGQRMSSGLRDHLSGKESKYFTEILFIGGWYGTSDGDAVTVYRIPANNYVKPNQLRNILAAENLKKGDVVILGQGKDKCVAEFDCFRKTNLGKDAFASFKWKFLPTCQLITSSVLGHFDNFIRFATEEEKQLLNPPLPKNELTVGTWYQRKDGILFNFSGKFGSYTQYGWNMVGEWSNGLGLYEDDVEQCTPASTVDVQRALKEESIKRGLVAGARFKHPLYDTVRTILNSEDYLSTTLPNTLNVRSPQEEWNYGKGVSNPRIYDNGVWAEVVKTVEKDVWVNIYSDGEEYVYLSEGEAVADSTSSSHTALKGKLTYEV